VLARYDAPLPTHGLFRFQPEHHSVGVPLMLLLLVPCERDQRKRPARAGGTQHALGISGVPAFGARTRGALGSCNEFPPCRGSHPVIQ
jgi:hypothetical protein